MEKITIHDSNHVNLWYYPDTKIMHTEMKKYTYGKDYRNFLDTVANSILKYKSQKLLSDDRNNQGIAKEDKKWGKNEWFPRAKSVVWRYPAGKRYRSTDYEKFSQRCNLSRYHH